MFGITPSWPSIAVACVLIAGVGVQTVRLADEQAAHAKDNSAWATEKGKLTDDALKESEDRRATEAALNAGNQKDIEDAQAKIKQAQADHVADSVALDGLRKRIAAIVAVATHQAIATPTAADRSATADAATRMLADVSGELARRADIYAGTSDDRGIAGEACTAWSDRAHAAVNGSK